MKITKMSYAAIAAISMMMGATVAVQAGSAIEEAPVEVNSFSNILSNGKYSFQIRSRYEFVDEDNSKKNANAFTVRTALGAKFDTLGIDGLATEIEMMDVRNFGADNYAPETAGYSIVADGEQTRVTQANISYTKDGFVGVVGRKGINLDNQRFIGTVNWRQMPQTYDLVSVAYQGIENLDLMAAYVWQVNRIFDREIGVASVPSLKLEDFKTNTVLLHASYKVAPELTITAYDYMIASFADHIGIRATGGMTMDNGIKLNYMAEYAKQADASLKENSAPFNDLKPDQDADYYRFDLSGSYSGYTLGASYEVLGEKGSGTNSFNTPFATGHAMNGWADMFLGTPADGLQDFSVKLGYSDKMLGNIMGVYHKFDSDAGSVDYGSEFDIVYTKNVMKNLNMMLKGTMYSQGDSATSYVDTTKYWVMFEYKL